VTNLLANTAWPSISDAPLVLVPLGSAEQYGPHLPVDTDSVIVNAVALGIVKRIHDARPPGRVATA